MKNIISIKAHNFDCPNDAIVEYINNYNIKFYYTSSWNSNSWFFELCI